MITNTQRLLSVTLGLVLIAGLVSPAFAGSKAGVGAAEMLGGYVPDLAPNHNEAGDAGSLPATADNVGGSGPLNTIAGTLTATTDNEDMYEICITSPSTFSAGASGQFDEQLFLFDANGLPIITDDDSGPGLDPLLIAGGVNSPTAVGIYYLAISDFNNDPRDTNVNPMYSGSNQGGPATAFPVASWTGSGGSFGTYNIVLTGASGTDNCQMVGGESLSIDTTTLILAGAQTNAAWLLSALAVIGSVAFGALYITSKKN